MSLKPRATTGRPANPRLLPRLRPLLRPKWPRPRQPPPQLRRNLMSPKLKLMLPKLWPQRSPSLMPPNACACPLEDSPLVSGKVGRLIHVHLRYYELLCIQIWSTIYPLDLHCLMNNITIRIFASFCVQCYLVLLSPNANWRLVNRMI